MAVSRCNCKVRNCGSGRKSGALSGWNLPYGVFACLLINVGPFETGRFYQRLRFLCNQNCGKRSRPRTTGVLRIERSSEATSKRAATVLLWCYYGVAPMWIAQLTDFYQLTKIIKGLPGSAPFSTTSSPKCATQRATVCCKE